MFTACKNIDKYMHAPQKSFHVTLGSAAALFSIEEASAPDASEINGEEKKGKRVHATACQTSEGTTRDDNKERRVSRRGSNTEEPRARIHDFAQTGDLKPHVLHPLCRQ